MKKLNIPSAMVGLMFGLIATVFVYLFVPPPSTASAADCPSSYQIERIVRANCADRCATRCASAGFVKKYADETVSELTTIIRRYCD